MQRTPREDRTGTLIEWHRSHDEGRIAGVCAGLAGEFDVPITVVRAGFLLAGLLGPSLFLAAGVYGVLWFLMPAEPGAESGLDRIVDTVTSLSGEARERVERSDVDFRG